MFANNLLQLIAGSPPANWLDPHWANSCVFITSHCATPHLALSAGSLKHCAQCLPQTWLLCVELQLVLIMAPLVYYLNRSYSANFGGASQRAQNLGPAGLSAGQAKKPQQQGTNNKLKAQASSTSWRRDSSRPLHWLSTGPGLLLGACIVFGSAASFYNVYRRQLPPSWFYTMADPDSKALYFGEHFAKLWPHVAVFALGLLAGLECRRAARRSQRHCRNSAFNNVSYLPHQRGQQKSHSSSTNSLATNANSNGQRSGSGASADTATFRLATGSTASSEGVWANGGSVSIGIHQPNQQQPAEQNNNNHPMMAMGISTDGSEIGCLHSASSETNTDRSAGGGGGRSRLAVLLDLIGFLAVITIMSAIIFSTHEWSLNHLPAPLVAGLYDAGSRLLWSLGLIWILYKLSVPQESVCSWPSQLLGHPVLVCLGKLSFLVYIIHPFVHTTVLAIQEQPIYSSWFMMFHILVGNISLTVILAALVSLFVEMPCRNLFRRCGTSLLLTQPALPGRTVCCCAGVGAQNGRL